MCCSVVNTRRIQQTICFWRQCKKNSKNETKVQLTTRIHKFNKLRSFQTPHCIVSTCTRRYRTFGHYKSCGKRPLTTTLQDGRGHCIVRAECFLRRLSQLFMLATPCAGGHTPFLVQLLKLKLDNLEP